MSAPAGHTATCVRRPRSTGALLVFPRVGGYGVEQGAAHPVHADVRESEEPYGGVHDHAPESSPGKRRRKNLPDVGATLRPGQKGTRRLLARYGSQLLCVRYRYDRKKGTRLTTVELLVSEAKWHPAPRSRGDTSTGKRLVEIHLASWESQLRAILQSAGAVWSTKRNAWILERRDAVRLGLRFRMNSVPSGSDKQPGETR